MVVPRTAGVTGHDGTEGVADFIRLGATFVTISALGLLRMVADTFRREVERAQGG